MSTNDQRGRTAQPVNVGGAVPRTAVAGPTELTHIEPTRIDEETQQGTYHTHFSLPFTHAVRAFWRISLRLRLTAGSVATYMTVNF